MNLIDEYFYEYETIIREETRFALQNLNIRSLVYRDQTFKILSFIDKLLEPALKEEKEFFYKNWNNAVNLLNRIADGKSDEYNESAIERVGEMINHAIFLKIAYSAAPQNLLTLSKKILSKHVFLYLLEKHNGNIPVGQLNFYNQEARCIKNKCGVNVEDIYNSL